MIVYRKNSHLYVYKENSTETNDNKLCSFELQLRDLDFLGVSEYQ